MTLVVSSVTVALTKINPVTNDLSIKRNIGGSEVIANTFAFTGVPFLPFEKCNF